MSSSALLKALDNGRLTHGERDALTGDELFVLVLARRLRDLSPSERSRLSPTDLGNLAALDYVPPNRAMAHSGL